MAPSIRAIAKSILPVAVLKSLKVARDSLRSLWTGVPRAPLGTDWVGYERLIGFIRRNGILSVPGDLLEIGTFLGGGAMKLSRYIEKHSPPGKRLTVIDVFDPTFDWTKTTEGNPMAELYQNALRAFHGKTQREVFSEVTKGCDNITVLATDSKKATIPSESLCFAFIDGNHDPAYVESDFNLAWEKLSPGGAVAFHDYDPQVLPQTTAKIEELARRHKDQIQKVEIDRPGLIFYAVKNS